MSRLINKGLENLTNNKGLGISVLILLSLIFLQLAACRPVLAASEGQVVMVIVDQITWNDFTTGPMPVLQRLARQGAVGLMTTNPAAGQLRIPNNTYAVIGAGAKIGGGPAGGLSLNADEPYQNGLSSDEYYRRTGRKAGSGEVVQLGIVEMEKANLSLKYDFSIGALGTILHQNGLKTAVLGNADPASLDVFQRNDHRQAAAVAMDVTGRVDYGDVSARTAKPDPGSLAGISTDYGYLLQRFDALRNKAALIVVETGDTSRLNTMQYMASDKAIQDQRKKVLASVDGFVGNLLPRLNLERDLLMVVVPGPPGAAMAEGRFLTPFIIAGKGVEPGITWSGTIKRNGLIANTDIAASVIGHFGLPAVIKGRQDTKDMRLGGQVIKSKYSADPFADINKMEADAVFLYNARYPLVKGYISSELVVVALAVAALLLRRRAVKYAVPVLVGFTVVPGVMLWANYFPHTSITAVMLEIIAVTAGVTWLALRIGRGDPLRPYLITTGVTALIVIIDILAGAALAKTSPLSYDVMSGARYYGIGNEYMGVVIGCVIVFAGLLLDMLKSAVGIIKLSAVVLFLAVIYIIAAPNLGTNVGGTIAAVAGLGASGLILFGGSVNKRSVVVICGGIAVVLACFITYDLTRAVEAQSHIGRTVSLIRENGFSEITNIISRKWAVNSRLIISTSWSWFYFMSLLVIMVFNRILPKPTAEFRQRYPWFNRMLAGVVLGSIFALIFNDSGIVAAATMIIFAIAPYLTGVLVESG